MGYTLARRNERSGGGTGYLRMTAVVKGLEQDSRLGEGGDKISEDDSRGEVRRNKTAVVGKTRYLRMTAVVKETEQDSRGGKNKISEDDSRGEVRRKKTVVVGKTRYLMDDSR
jgi:hypothetical protein